MKRKIYIVSTLIIVILIGFVGGAVDILLSDSVIKIANDLGYPLYFFTALGVLKIVGGAMLLLPKKLDRIRDFAYAGFALDFLFASYSHYSSGSNIEEVIIPFVFLVILAISYSLKNKTTLFKSSEL
ncbi:DoxX family protein [Malaciobacter canalis]|uniref:DoxX family protein n=1 Tax=Malaciobacter canalis TaxID=1912871 RepID=UPI00384B5742